MSDRLLPRRGTLVAWTTQGFPPGVIRVEGGLTENDPDKLEFGMAVELTMVPLTTDDDRNEVMTFAFSPSDDRSIL